MCCQRRKWDGLDAVSPTPHAVWGAVTTKLDEKRRVIETFMYRQVESSSMVGSTLLHFANPVNQTAQCGQQHDAFS